MEFLLNRGGLRVVFGKTQGLFNKTPGRRGIEGYRLLDLDLQLGLEMRPNRYPPIRTVGSRSRGSDSLWHNLISAVHSGSDVQGRSGSGQWQGSPEMLLPRGSSQELAKLGPPGRNLSGKRVREVRLNTRNPPRVTAGLVEALGGKPTSNSGPARHDSLACAFTRCSGPKNGGKRFWVRAPCKNTPESGLSGAV
jgi:hypothetical protein